MSASKRPSTSSLRRFITSRPFVTVAELRRRFSLDEPDAMALLRRNGTSAWIGLPEREASKLQDLWDRNELGVELSVEVRAPVVVGVYPMRIARYVMDTNGSGNGRVDGTSATSTGSMGDGPRKDNGPATPGPGNPQSGHAPAGARPHPHAPRPMSGAPAYGSDGGTRSRDDSFGQ